MKTTLLGLAALLLSACSTSLEGDWRGENLNECGRSEFSLDDSLRGDGTMRAEGDDGCAPCDFELRGEDRGGGRFLFEVEFDSCSCEGDRTAEADCDLNSAGDRLSCAFEMSCGARWEEDFDLRN